MLRDKIIRAWKDPEYRQSLSEEEREHLPENPAGAIELTDEELDMAAGGSWRGSRSYSQSSRPSSYSQSSRPSSHSQSSRPSHSQSSRPSGSRSYSSRPSHSARPSTSRRPSYSYSR
jgi:mersacidin/lichenicidin family type 2 lantibiotic